MWRSPGRRAITASPSSPASLSRVVERRDICGRGHARHLSVTLGGGAQAKPLVLHNVYVPAGGDVPDPALNPKFRHKLDFLEAMEAWFAGIAASPRTA